MTTTTTPSPLLAACQAEFPGLFDAQLQCFTDALQAHRHHHQQDLLVWSILLAAALVFLMQAGFAMVCAGCVRKKNLQNTMMKNLLDAAGAAVAFFMTGYGLAFGDDNDNDNDNDAAQKTLAGTRHFATLDSDEIDMALWFFQYACSATTVTIVAGALAERCRISAYLCYSLVLTGLVYPLVVHAIWSSHGYLSITAADPWRGVGVLDFAGSGVIHVTGGWTALMAAVLLGPRRGRFHDANTGEVLAEPKEIPGHSKGVQMLGTFVLWFGWYGFNPGSALLRGLDYPVGTLASRAAITTSLAAGFGAVSTLLGDFFVLQQVDRTGFRHFSLDCAMNGLLSGLVAVTAGCATVTEGGAIVIGIVAGGLYLLSSWLLVYFKIDDVVQAIPVHFVCGAWGLIAAGLFSTPDRMQDAFGIDQHAGLFYEWARGSSDMTLFGNQILGLFVIVGWVGLTMGPFFALLNQLGMLRTVDLYELVGLDQLYHDGVYTEGAAQTDKIRLAKRVQQFIKKNKNDRINEEQFQFIMEH